MELLSTQLFNGLLIGTTIALTALGLSLVFGILNIVNLSHGEFYMLGAYFTWALNSVIGNFWVAVAISVVLTGLLGGGLLMAFFRSMQTADHMRWALLTLGFGYVLREGVQRVFGVDFKLVELPLDGSFAWFGGTYRLTVMLIGLVLIVSLATFLKYTKHGLLIRGVADNAEASAVAGVSTFRTYFVVCLVSSGLAGAAGALMLPITSAYPAMGLEILIMAFVVVVVGGLGNIRGTLLASLLAGELQSLLTLVMKPSAAILVSLLTLMLILVARGVRRR